MKPRILQVIDHTGDGGAQVVVFQMVHSLRNNYDFSLINLGWKGQFSEEYRALGVAVYELGNSRGRWDPSLVIKLARIVRETQPDLVHTHLYKSNILGAMAAKFAGVKLLLHDHMGVYPLSLSKYPNYFPSRLLQTSYLLAYRCALDWSFGVVVLTAGMKKAYLNFYKLKEEKISVIPNAVDLKKYEKNSADFGTEKSTGIRQELELSEDTKLVTMIGRLEPEKDWLTFLHVAKNIQKDIDNPVAFLIIGSGGEESELRRYVDKHGIKSIYFLGYRNDIPKLLFESDVFLLTSKSEPFGIVVLEAMAAGCPVIATRSGGPENILKHEITGLLAESGDGRSLSNHVIRVLRDGKLRNSIILNAQRAVKEDYCVEKIATKISTIYTSSIWDKVYCDGFQ